MGFERLSFGANELAHLELVGTIVHQLTKRPSIEEIEKAGLSAYYTDHGVGAPSLLILLLIIYLEIQFH